MSREENNARHLCRLNGPHDSGLHVESCPDADEEEESVPRVQLVVWHRGTHLPTYYTIPPGQGWRIDCDTRHLVIGRGLPRKHVPLDNVLSYDIEEL